MNITRMTGNLSVAECFVLCAIRNFFANVQCNPCQKDQHKHIIQIPTDEKIVTIYPKITYTFS